MPVKLVEAPSNSLLTVPRRWFCCGSLLPVFGVGVSVTFHLNCVHVVLGSVWVAGWPLFGKWLLARLAVCSLCVLAICNFSYFPFGFKGWIRVLIASVPDLCIRFTIFVIGRIYKLEIY